MIKVLKFIMICVILQMTVDEAAIHAAIMAVNEALEKENSAEIFNALSNPNACLTKLDQANADRYHSLLLGAKREKAAKCQVSGKGRKEGGGGMEVEGGR